MKYAKLLIFAALLVMALYSLGIAASNKDYIQQNHFNYSDPQNDMLNYGSPSTFSSPMHIGGFTGDKRVTSVKNVAEMEEKESVIMRGYLLKQITENEYEFKDDSGKIIVEIEDTRWFGNYVGPQDLVEVRGIVDTHRSKPSTVEVHRVMVMSRALPK